MDFASLRSQYPGYGDDEILGALQATKYPDYGIDEIKSALGYAPPEQPGDTFRGLKESFQQLPQLGYGILAGFGAAAENVVGEGGIATGIKKAGVKGYTEWGDKIAAGAKPSDSIDYSWEQAKQGNFGALVDWLQHGIGYVGGQGLQMLATAGIGAAGGKLIAGTAAKQIAEGMVAKETARLVAENAGKEVAERVAADQITKAAVANVAGKFSTIGMNAALGGAAVGMEGGEIFGGLTQQAEKEGRMLTGAELGKAFGATLAAGGLEFVGDKLGLDIVLGKSRFLKPTEYMKGIGGRASRGILAAGMQAPIEAGTEYGQTLLEEYGKGNDPTSDESLKQARESAWLGALGGTVVGGVGGAIHGAKERPAEKPITDGIDKIVGAGSVDEAITAAAQIVSGKTAAPSQDDRAAAVRAALDRPSLDALRAQYRDLTPILASLQQATNPNLRADLREPHLAALEATIKALRETPKSMPVGEVSEAIPTGDAVEMPAEEIPVGEATESLPTADVIEVVPDTIPAGDATELEPDVVEPKDARPGEAGAATVLDVVHAVGGKDPHTVLFTRREADGRLTRVIEYPDGQRFEGFLVTDKNDDEHWVSSDLYNKGNYYPVKTSPESAAARAQEELPQEAPNRETAPQPAPTGILAQVAAPAGGVGGNEPAGSPGVPPNVEPSAERNAGPGDALAAPGSGETVPVGAGTADAEQALKFARKGMKEPGDEPWQERFYTERAPNGRVRLVSYKNFNSVGAFDTEADAAAAARELAQPAGQKQALTTPAPTPAGRIGQPRLVEGTTPAELASDIPTLKKQWQDAVRANDSALAKRINARIVEVKNAAPYDGPTMAEVEAVQDIPTTEKMREAIAAVGEAEFTRMVEERFAEHKPQTENQKAMLVEAAAIHAIAMNRRKDQVESLRKKKAEPAAPAAEAPAAEPAQTVPESDFQEALRTARTYKSRPAAEDAAQAAGPEYIVHGEPGSWRIKKSDAPIQQPAAAPEAAVEAPVEVKPERDPAKIELRKRLAVLERLAECLG